MSHNQNASSRRVPDAKGDIPYARLHGKESSDFSLAIARNDAKRFEDILRRIKGIDSSAFRLVVASQGPDLNMIEERSSSPGLLARILSRAPEEVFDWLAGELLSVNSIASSWVALEGIRRSGALRDPRFMAKLLAGLDRSATPINIDAVSILANARVPRQQSNNSAQEARWASQAAEARNLVVEYLSLSNPAALAAEIPKLNGSRSLGDFPLLQEAISLAEKKEIAEGAAATSPAQRARPPSL